MTDRRRGPGFDGGRSVDPGRRDDYDPFDDDEEVEATRAMDVMSDDFPPPTQQVGGGSRAPAPPPPSYDAGHDDDDATRVLSAADFEDFGAMAPAPPPPEPVMTPMELRVVAGPDRGKSFPLKQGDALVGRGLDCGIVVADPAVSRKHFRVVRREDFVEVVDMGGANGTTINGARIARHELQPGDRIEVGTTVLEFQIEGVEPMQAQHAFGSQSAVSMDAGQATGAGGRSKFGLFIGLAVAGLLLLVGGAATAYFVVFNDSGKVEDKGAEAGGQDINAQIKKAKGLMGDREWADAIDLLKEVKKASPNNGEVKGMLTQAEEEQEFKEGLDKANSLAKDKKYEEAIKLLKDVPTTSLQYDDAKESLKELQADWLQSLLVQARKAVDDGKSEQAAKLVKQVLKLDPKHAEAKMLLAEANGSAELKLEPTKAKGAGKPSESASKVFKRALTAYHNRKWSAAKQSLGVLVGGPYKKGERRKAAKYKRAIELVAAAMAFAETGGSAISQARALKKAYNADKDVDGHFSAELVKKIVDAYVKAARAQYNKRHYGKAMQLVREAQNYDPEHGGAAKLENDCTTKAESLLKQAQSHMDKKHFAKAKELAQEVLSIVPSRMNPTNEKARKIALKAQEKNNSGDDD